MTTLRQAAQQALEALETYKGFIDDAHIIEGQWHWLDGSDNAITALRTALEQPEQECWCHKCNENRLVNNIPFSATRMILCPTCGNKRCPKASDHCLDCTDSNEPNQPGSLYTTPPATQPEQVVDCPRCGHVCSQRKWVGLTDEDWRDVANETDRIIWPEVRKAIEAKLKERNT
jgi:hypothetical protein